MKHLLTQLLSKIVCHHEWFVHSRVRWEDPDMGDTWRTEVLICKKCGKIKRIKL